MPLLDAYEVSDHCYLPQSVDGIDCEPQQDLLEAIAVVGFSIKFPQDAVSPASFWSMLEERRCAMTTWPEDRINLDAFYHPDSDRRDTISVRGGHFLKEDLAIFDASFFSITASEAMAMDPQQRMLLETAYTALENAGIPLKKAFGTKTGVYTGSMSPDYQIVSMKDVEELPKYAATGCSTNMLANRISWFFNFLGPSVNLDSACSSSLMALDIACQGLRSKDSSMALVAGANIVLALELVLSLNNMGFLSPDSRCYSFDDRANGYARGEGCGVVVIKRVSDAIRDGDTIRAIIRSSGSNQDGHTPGLTQPSRDSQASLIRETYEKAGLDFSTTRFFEAHGTGTTIGDPTEADAIGSVFRRYRSPADPLYIGAVKSSIGHLEGASGIAGLIKAILVLEKGVIPPNANFERINSKIDAEFLNIKIPTEMTPWPVTGLRRVSVNSFGIGGSNAHVVLEDAYNYLRLRKLKASHATMMKPPIFHSRQISPVSRGPLNFFNDIESDLEMDEFGHIRANSDASSAMDIIAEDVAQPLNRLTKQKNGSLTSKVLIWSAADEGGLTRMIAAYHEYFLKMSFKNLDEGDYLEALSYTLGLRRSSFQWKTYAVAQSVSDLSNLTQLVSVPVRSNKKTGIGFIFTGQGSQYKGMGRDLLSFPVFAKTLRSIDSIFCTLGCKWSLLDILIRDEDSSSIDLPEYSQPLSTALQIGLVELLRAFNISPSAVLGHSSGEIAAAYAVGGLSLQSACKVSYFRGELAGSLARDSNSNGTMMSVNASETEMSSILNTILSKNQLQSVHIACFNSPRNVTISGDEALIDIIKSQLELGQIFARKVNTGVAYHSPWMEVIADQYESSIQGLEKGIRPRQDIVMFSSVTGEKLLTTDALTSPEYWVKNMVQPVRFSQAVAGLVSTMKTSQAKKLGAVTQGALYDLIEIGPHSTLKRPIVDTLESLTRKAEIRYSCVLSRYSSSLTTTLKTVGQLYQFGYDVCLQELNRSPTHPATHGFLLSDLPEYPFNRSQKYWHESSLSKKLVLRQQPRLELLGTPATDWNPLEGRWRRFFDPAEMPWVEDHKVSGTVIYPAAGMIVMAIEGAKQMTQSNRPIVGYHLKDATFSHAISINTSGRNTEARLSMRPMRNSEREFTTYEYRICVLENVDWIETCHGTIQVQYQRLQAEVVQGREQVESLKEYRRRLEDAALTCKQTVKKSRMYKHFHAIGLDYGPTFQALDGLAWDGHNVAIGEIKTFQPDIESKQSYVQPYTIHPVTLDAAAQLMWVALTRGGTTIIPTGVPTRMRDVWISNSGLGYSEPITLRACTVSNFKGLRGTDCSMFALDDTGNLKVSISHMETTAVSGHDSFALQHSGPRQLCFNIEWKPDPSLLSSEQILAVCGYDRVETTEPVQFYQDLGLLLYSYIKRTLEDIKELPVETFKPHIRRYIDWMRVQDEKYQSGRLPNSDPDWATRSKDAQRLDSLSVQLENMNAQGKLFVTFGRQLTSVIRGTVDPLEILFILDIELDPKDQGYEPGSYDLVVACNVLHTTRDLGVTLQNTRRLLKPDGKLVLLEITEPEILRCNFAYGTLPGWWMGTESYREWSPCVTEAQWDTLLSGHGFSGVDFVLRDYQMDRAHEMSLMVSTAAVNAVQPHIQCSMVILIDPESQIQTSLGNQICQRLQKSGESDCEVLSIREISTLQHCASCIFLPELERPMLHELDDPGFERLKSFLSGAQYVLWVRSAERTSSMSPKLEMVTGLSRVLRAERSNLSFVNLGCEDLHKSLEAMTDTVFRVLEATYSRSLGECETEYLDRDNMLWINRVVEANYLNREVHSMTATQSNIKEFQSGPPLALTVTSPGLLDSMRFIEDRPYAMELNPNEIEIEVKAVGVNFRDLLVVLGKNDEGTIGCECAGIVTRIGSSCIEFQPGDRVCAAIIGCANTYARGDSQLAIKLPGSMSYEEGAALPITGVTAYYALVEMARLQSGESILIHSGSGGTGQMAIQIAQWIGAEVFVTVGFEDKKRLVMELYRIPEDHILYSRDTSFAAGIMRMTGNRGVDVILNSLSGDSLLASWQSVAPFGRFVEIGKADIHANSSLPMAYFAKTVSFFALAVDYMITHRPTLIRKSLAAVMDMLTNGNLKTAYPLHTYPISKVEEAFRFLQSGRNTGKTVLTISPTDLVATFLRTKPTFELDPNAAYLIAGGLGGLGRSAAVWMVSRGARNLILLSQSGPKSEAACDLVKELESRGVSVSTPKCDVSCAESLANALNQSAMAPIKGCIQGTMRLQDALFEKMTFVEWITTVRSKVQSSWNLHTQLPQSMDFFVLLSSVAGIIGSIGQSNYSAGNTYQDSLARYRVSIGQKATSLDLGWMGDVGIIAENEDLARGKEVAADMACISETEFHALLAHCCAPTSKLHSLLQAQAIIGLVTPAQFRSKGLEPPDWTSTPLFSTLQHVGLEDSSSSAGNAGTSQGGATVDTVDYAAAFARSPSQEEAADVVTASLVSKLARAISVLPGEIDTTKPLHAYGVDSLLAVELRNWFAKTFKADVAVFEIMGKESVAAVGAAVAEKSVLKRES